MVIIKDLAIIIAILYTPWLQSFIARKCIDYFANEYNIELSVGDAYFKMPNKVVLSDIEMKDSCGNMLLSAVNLDASIETISFEKEYLALSEINLNSPHINVIINENGTANYSYILNKFASEDTMPDFSVVCKKLSITNGHLKYLDERHDNTGSSFKASDMEINNFNAGISKFGYQNDTISVNIDNFSLNEKSGIAINNFSCKIKYYDKGFSVNDLTFKTNYSELVCSEISISGKDSLYLSNPIEKIEKFNINIDTLIFSIADLSPFLPQCQGLSDSLHLRGNFSGRPDDLKFRDFGISMYNDTRLYANLSVTGLPELEQTIVFGSISNMRTNKEDLNRILKLVSHEKPIKIPTALKSLNWLAFNGNISGMLNDMVAYGQFTTNIGTVKTDLAIMPDWKTMAVKYDGNICAQNINLHEIISGYNNLGLLSMTMNIKGNIDSQSHTQNKINGKIQRLDFNKYSYNNIDIKGELTDTTFNGNINIDDPNIRAEIIGYYDFGNKKNNKIEISSDIYANLKELNIAPKNTNNSELKIVIGAQFVGDLKNRPVGNITLSNIEFNIDDKHLKINKISAISKIDEYKKYSIKIDSNILELDMYGNFNISEVPEDIYYLVAKSIPSGLSKYAKKKHNNNYFTYHFKIKHINDITKFYDKDLRFHGDIYSSNGYVFGDTETLYGKILMPQITNGDYEIGASEIEIYSKKGISSVNVKSSSIKTSKFLFENIKLAMTAENDNVGLNLNWKNEKTSNDNGSFLLDAKIIPHGNDSSPRIEAKILPSQFTFGENTWELGETHINYDNREVEIENLKLSNANQILNVKGYISKDPNKKMSFLIDNVDLNNINPLTQPIGYEFGGILSGSGRISNIYDIPVFTTNFNIHDLSINQEQLGKLNLSSKWDNQNNAFVISGTNKFVEMKGTYLTEQDSLDASIILKNLKLNIFDKFLNKYEICDINGEANGAVMLNGSIKNPSIDGTINLNRTEFTYNYLKLKAITEDEIHINNDSIFFDNFKIRDENGNIGIINGGLYHDNFKNFRFGFLGNLEDFKVMNTKMSDNNLFYGTVYASGGITVEGTPNNLSIYAGATTGPNTKFVLPMEDSYKAQNTSYITFITEEDTETDISDMRFSTMDYSIKLDIEVKPEAEVQIVFDPRAGDRIKANGEGMLKVEYNSDDKLYMYGEIEISKGDYLFTLENIINKRFTISPGGTITWDGNPYEGKLNLDAVYTTSVSLKELMREEYDSTDNSNKKATVECHMHIIGNLMSPEIQFSIKIPNGSEKVKTKLASLTQDEINKQLLYVLVINQFYDPNSEMLNQTGSTTNAVGVTTTQMLSNQLSNWLSKIVKDVDVGFQYRPSTEFSGQEVEVALSTQIFNDRLLINGNLGISEKKFDNENIVGDVEVQWKLNKKGSIRIKGFSRKNTDIEAEYGPYTTGAGIFYTEEFNTFGELMRKIWNDLTFKQAREKRKAKKVQKKTSVKENRE